MSTDQFSFPAESPPSSHSLSVLTARNQPINSLNTTMASLNIEETSHDTVDGQVELPNDIDVVFVDGGDKKLCLATCNHADGKITGCGRGNSRESARQSAIDNLTSNFRILCTPLT